MRPASVTVKPKRFWTIPLAMMVSVEKSDRNSPRWSKNTQKIPGNLKIPIMLMVFEEVVCVSLARRSMIAKMESRIRQSMAAIRPNTKTTRMSLMNAYK